MSERVHVIVNYEDGETEPHSFSQGVVGLQIEEMPERPIASVTDTQGNMWTRRIVWECIEPERPHVQDENTPLAEVDDEWLRAEMRYCEVTGSFAKSDEEWQTYRDRWEAVRDEWERRHPAPQEQSQ